MSRKNSTKDGQRGGPLWTLAAWSATLLFFAPVAWMMLTSLHHEADAATNPPSPLAPLSRSACSTTSGPWSCSTPR